MGKPDDVDAWMRAETDKARRKERELAARIETLQWELLLVRQTIRTLTAPYASPTPQETGR